MRKGAAAVAVTQGQDAGHVRLQLIINDDVAAFVGRNPFPPIPLDVTTTGSTR